jgi:hypothetical protein
VSHRNAPLSETGRLRLARCVVEDGWPLRRAAERFQVSPTTAARWASRYRQLGAVGMADRSSRPHRSPGRIPTRTERRIVKLRVLHRWGPAGIGWLLGLHPSTVHRVLARYRLARLAWLDRHRTGDPPLRTPSARRADSPRRQETRPHPRLRWASSARAGSRLREQEEDHHRPLPPRPTQDRLLLPTCKYNRVRTPIQRRAMVRAMKACQRVLLAVTVEGRNVGHVGHGGP